MIAETVLSETDEYRVIEERDDSIRYVGRRVEWKPGTSERNHEEILAKVEQAIAYFGPRGLDTWSFSGLTNPQKDAHIQRMNRALADLARLVREDYSTPGS